MTEKRTTNIPSFDSLKARLGEDHLRKRLLKQADHWATNIHQGEGIFRLEKYISIDRLAKFGLQATGLWQRAHQNIFRIQTTEIVWNLPRLPDNFDGLRLLQLSDLHIDIDPRLAECIAAKVKATPHDVMVITGDYRNSTVKDYGPSMSAMSRIIQSSSSPQFGILGNHDFLEMVHSLEDMGLVILLNESASLSRGEEKIWIAGTDDSHFYQTHDFMKARSKVPENAFCVLLCHSPEVHVEASHHDFDLMLSGHTHGGQICLPGGRHIVCPVNNLDKSYIKDRWISGKMRGYTSRGTGSCGVAARLNCMPELTVHILKRSMTPSP